MSIQIDRLVEITNSLYQAEDIYTVGPFCSVDHQYSAQILVAPKSPSYDLQTLNDFQKKLFNKLKPDRANLAKTAPEVQRSSCFYNLGGLYFDKLGVVSIKNQGSYYLDCNVDIYPSPELVELALYGILIRDLIKARKIDSDVTPVSFEGYGSERYGGWDTLSLTQNLHLMSDNLFSNRISVNAYKVLLETYLADVIGAHGHNFISVAEAIRYLDKKNQ